MKKFDIDCEALQKGDIIPADKIESVTETTRGTAEYNFACLSVRKYIEDTLRASGSPVTLCSRGHDLVVLTDSAAYRHNDKLVRQQLQGIRRAHKRMQEVDTDNLTADEQTDHERRLIVQSRYVQAIESTRKKIAIKPVKRTVPVLS